MAAQGLTFNILTFDWPKGQVKFYFKNKKQEKYSRIFKGLFPPAFASILPNIPADQKVITTSFTGEANDVALLKTYFKIEIPDLIKQYYNRRIYYYFRKLKPGNSKPPS
jgi:hypothetical protein